MSEKKQQEVLAFKRGVETGLARVPQNAKAWMRIEQKRIIKLLQEASNCKCSPEYGVDYDSHCYCDAIALIKGDC